MFDYIKLSFISKPSSQKVIKWSKALLSSSPLCTMDVHSRPVIASLYSRVSSGANSPRPSSSHPLASVSLSPDGAHAVAAGKDVLHVLGLKLDGGRNGLQEIRSVRISQVSKKSSCLFCVSFLKFDQFLMM